MNEPVYPRVQAQLGRLKLPRMAECLDSLAEQAAKHEWTYLDFLDQSAGGRSVGPLRLLGYCHEDQAGPFPVSEDLGPVRLCLSNPPSVSGRPKSWRPCASWPTASHPVTGSAGCGQNPGGDCLGSGSDPTGGERVLHHHGRLARGSFHRDAKEDRLAHRLDTLVLAEAADHRRDGLLPALLQCGLPHSGSSSSAAAT